jgi:hypothetical protein
MTLTTAPILLYLVALFLTVATLWIFWHAIETLGPNEIDRQFFWVAMFVIIPFVILIYFGLSVLIYDAMVGGAGITTLPLQLSLSTNIPAVAILTYIGLSTWLRLRWRKLMR